MLSGAFPCAKITKGVIFPCSPNGRNGKLLFTLTTVFMTFVAAGNDWTNERTPTKASVTYTAGMMIVNDTTNDVPATAQSKQYLRGILIESKASSSATTTVTLQVPKNSESTFYGDMTTGETLAATDIGKCFDFAADGLTVSTNTTYKPLQLVKYISSTKGVFKFNKATGVNAS